MNCGERVLISGLPQLIFRCCREKNHEGLPHAISLGQDLLRKLKAKGGAAA